MPWDYEEIEDNFCWESASTNHSGFHCSSYEVNISANGW